MKPLRYCTKAEEHAYMDMRQRQNRSRSVRNSNENWMAAKLRGTGKKWTRQAQWGYRLFDFWCAELGVAVEVDGPEHVRAIDDYRDEYNYRRSGIVVLRVKNLDEEGADRVLKEIVRSCTWQERRERLGLGGKGSGLVNLQDPVDYRRAALPETQPEQTEQKTLF